MQLYPARLEEQAGGVDFSHHVEKWHHPRRKSATFYLTGARSLS